MTEKIINDYGTCGKKEVDAEKYGWWHGNIFVNINDIKINTEEEYNIAFPDAGPSFETFKGIQKLNIEGDYSEQFTVEDLFSLAQKSNIEYEMKRLDYDKDEFEMWFNTDIYADYDQEDFLGEVSYEVYFEATLEGEEISFDELSDSSKEHIIGEMLKGYKQGELVEYGTETVYEIYGLGDGIFAPIEASGTIDELIEMAEQGEIKNTGSLMAALEDAEMYDMLDFMEQMKIDSEKNRLEEILPKDKELIEQLKQSKLTYDELADLVNKVVDKYNVCEENQWFVRGKIIDIFTNQNKTLDSVLKSAYEKAGNTQKEQPTPTKDLEK
jgi:hypothetical protein